MGKLILASHGRFSEELKRSLEMIMGDQEDMLTITLEPSDGEGEFISKWNDLVGNVDEYTVFVDLLGGTPCNLIVKWAMENSKSFDIYAGMNLPMLINYLNNSYAEIEGDLINQTRDSIVHVNELIGL